MRKLPTLSSFAKVFAQALVARPDPSPGTYELCGPKVSVVWHHPDGRMAKLERRDALVSA